MDVLTFNIQDLNIDESLFKDVKFYITGDVNAKILEVLSSGGAEKMTYFSDYVTHLICGNEPEETDLTDASEVYEIPAITEKWVLISARLKRMVDTKLFKYEAIQLFMNMTFSFSNVGDDLNALWAVVTYNGGTVKMNFDSTCTHLCTTDIKSKKYEKAIALDRLKIVTPDWVLESAKNKSLSPYELFHPKLLTYPKPRESTALITGFENDDTEKISDIPDTESTQALLDQLKQRMPWNQPAVEKKPSFTAPPNFSPNKVRPNWVQSERPNFQQPAQNVAQRSQFSPNQIRAQQRPQFQNQFPNQEFRAQFTQNQNFGQAQFMQKNQRPPFSQWRQQIQQSGQLGQQIRAQNQIGAQLGAQGSQMSQNQLGNQQLSQNQISNQMNAQNQIGQQINQSQIGNQQLQQSQIGNQQLTGNQIGQQLTTQNQVGQIGSQNLNSHLTQTQISTQQLRAQNQINAQQLTGQISQLGNQLSQNQIGSQLDTQQQIVSQQLGTQISAQQINQIQANQNPISLNQQINNQLSSQLGTQNQQIINQSLRLNQELGTQNQQLNQNQLLGSQLGAQNLSAQNLNAQINQQQIQNQLSLTSPINQNLGQIGNQQSQLEQNQLGAQLGSQGLNQQLGAQIGNQVQNINQQNLSQMISQSNLSQQLNQQNLSLSQPNLGLPQQNLTQQSLNQRITQAELNQNIGLSNMSQAQQGLTQNQQLNQQMLTNQLNMQLNNQQHIGIQNKIGQIGLNQIGQINQTNQQISGQLTNQQLSNQQLANQQLANQQLTNQQIGNQQLTNQQLNSQQLTNQQLNNQQITNQQLGNQQISNVQIPQNQVIMTSNQIINTQINQIGLQQQQIKINQQLNQQINPNINQQIMGQQIKLNQGINPQIIQQQQIINQQHLVRPQIGAPRLNWSPNQQVVQQRQFIQLDAQTHQQLQQMDAAQRSAFIARIQKHRQLMLQKQLAQQQQRGGHIVIRGGAVPPGLTPQQQVQWLQQQGAKQQVVMQQQNVVAQHAPGLSPIAQNTQQIVGDQNQIQIQRQQQFQRLQQLQLQREQAQKAQLSQPAVPRPPITPQVQAQPAVETPVVAQTADAQANSQQLVVNAKTKTALANMLSIRLQSGNVSMPTVPEGEPSAAGTLRMMTAQHNASLNPSTRPQEILAMQQRRALGNITNGEMARPTAPAQVAQTTGQDVKQQFSPGRSLPPQTQRHGPFYGHNPNLKLPPDLFLLGCIFVVVEIENYLEKKSPEWRQVIERHGGEIEPVYCTRVTHVLCETQRHGVVMQALRDFKRCVTIYWLNDVVQRKQVVPPWQALHLPTGYIDGAPASRHLISLSGFTGNDRARVIDMINYTGAKYTPYFTKNNTVLVCSKPEGSKFQHAKKWNTPIVNVQWLTDLMLGNFSALNQIEHVKYQQFSQPVQFGFDTALVPNLMFAWKMPINISQESYERVKRSPSPVLMPPKPKKMKMDQIKSETSDTPMEVVQSSEISSTHSIMFSLCSDKPDLEQYVRKLGGSLATNMKNATHLVMGYLGRTPKLINAITLGLTIVPDSWLRQSYEEKKFISESTFKFDTKEFNDCYKCDFYKSLEVNGREKLFCNKIFFITPIVYRRFNELKEIIELAGGVIEKKRRSLQQIESVNSTIPFTYNIITAVEDLHLVYDCLRNSNQKFVSSSEVIFNSILNQKFNVEEFLVKIEE